MSRSLTRAGWRRITTRISTWSASCCPSACTASTIAAQKIPHLGRHARQLESMIQMVHEAANILRHPSRLLREIGTMLGEAWRLKKELADCVSNSTIDEIYDAAMKAGALGGKLLGAGGGAFMLFFAEPAFHE